MNIQSLFDKMMHMSGRGDGLWVSMHAHIAAKLGSKLDFAKCVTRGSFSFKIVVNISCTALSDLSVWTLSISCTALSGLPLSYALLSQACKYLMYKPIVTSLPVQITVLPNTF
jgi:hypothetical protein